MADTQPGRVVCCGQAVGSVSLFLDIHLGIEPRDMQTQQQALTALGAPMSHVHPPNSQAQGVGPLLSHSAILFGHRIIMLGSALLPCHPLPFVHGLCLRLGP